ncbi:MAG TPA: phage major capsid protein [Pricia sp.]|nr:phage major capsid protein [Pricia sp.]
MQADARAKIDRLKEIRELKAEDVTEEIREEMKTLMDDLDTIKTDIKDERRAIDLETSLAAPDVALTVVDGELGGDTDRSGMQVGDNREGKKPWESFGHMLIAVRQAAIMPGQTVDQRLLENRAATGLGEEIPSDGGFLVQKDHETELMKRTNKTGVLVPRVERVPISSNANGLKMYAVDENSRVNGSRWGGIQVYSDGEADTISATKPKFKEMTWDLKRFTGLCYATDELLKDTAALGTILMKGFSEEFGFKLDDNIINGTGAGMFVGVLNSAALVSVAKETGQAAKTLLAENIIKMWSRMHARSRANAVWFINQDVEPQLFTMSIAVGTGGVPVYMPPGGLSASPYGMLFSRPVIAIEQAQTLGTKGDIYLLDLKQYLMIDKGRMESARSMHVQFLTAQEVFRFIYRADGAPLWTAPLTPFKGTNTLSPFISLDTRS